MIDGESNDDAAVYLYNGKPIVLTTDFFSPVVKDAYQYGAIAAANALSDLYAMNSEPLFCLCVAGFNSARMNEQTISQIMQGAVDKCREAGVIIAGGHTIEAVEPFFGLVCAGGASDFSNIRRNTLKLNKDVETYLVLTKELGVGMVTNAAKKQIIENVENGTTLYQRAVMQMSSLNDSIKNLTDKKTLNALTDVTGFGLVGHLAEMLGTEFSAEVYFKSLPVLDGVHQLYQDFGDQIKPNGNNGEYARNRGFEIKVQEGFQKAILEDPNTSGGLLVAVDGLKAAELAAQ